MKITVRQAVLSAVLSGVLVVLQLALSLIPNVEVISLLIVMYTLQFGKKTIYTIYVFVLLQGILYGFGMWWIAYLYVWTILYAIAYLFRAQQSVLFWSILNGFFGLSFGVLAAIPYAVAGGIPAALTWWAGGMLFDVIHGISNFIITFVLWRPLLLVFQQLKPYVGPPKR